MDARQEGVGRLHDRSVEAQVCCDGTERQEGVAAGRTVRDVLGEQAIRLGRILAGEAPQGVAREQLVDGLVAVRHAVSSNAVRSFRIAAKVRVFTVPSGMPSSSAICTCV